MEGGKILNHFAFHVWGDENIIFDTTINGVNSDTTFSFVAPQNIVVDLPDSISFPEDSSASVPFVVNAPYGYDSVNVYSSNGIVNASMSGDNLIITGNPNANGLDDIIITIFGSDETIKNDTITVNVEPRSDVYFEFMRSNFTPLYLSNIDSVRVIILENGNNREYIVYPDSNNKFKLDKQFTPGDSVVMWVGGYGGNYVYNGYSTFIERFNFNVPETDVDTPVVVSMFPYDTWIDGDGNVPNPDSILQFLTYAKGIYMSGSIDFLNMRNPNAITPPDSTLQDPPQVGRSFKTITVIAGDIDTLLAPDYGSFNPTRIDTIETIINDFYNDLPNDLKPIIVVADTSNIENYVWYDGQHYHQVPGVVAILPDIAPNAYSTGVWIMPNGQIYKAAVSLQGAPQIPLNIPSVASEILSGYEYAYEMNGSPFPSYTVTDGAYYITEIDKRVRDLGILTNFHGTNTMSAGPVDLRYRNININGHPYYILTVSNRVYLCEDDYWGGHHDPNTVFLRTSFPEGD